MYGKSTLTGDITVDKCDIWDGNGTHAQFTTGKIHQSSDNSRGAQWKIKLESPAVAESQLPGDLTGFYLYCSDTDGEVYEGTIAKCRNRPKNCYCYIPRDG